MYYEPEANVIELEGADCIVCEDYGWICEDHDQLACACGGVEKPCRCNPEAWLPDGFEAVVPADFTGLSAASALGFGQKV